MSMNEQQALQETELRMNVRNEKQAVEVRKSHLTDGVVRRVDSLQTLFARNTNADVGRLDHADIVGTITNGECHRADAFLDEANDEGFLQWRHSTTNDSFAKNRQAKQQAFTVIFG